MSGKEQGVDRLIVLTTWALVYSHVGGVPDGSGCDLAIVVLMVLVLKLKLKLKPKLKLAVVLRGVEVHSTRLPHFNGNRDRCRRYHNSDVPYCMSWLRQLVPSAWSCSSSSTSSTISSGWCEKLSGNQSLLCVMLGPMFKLKSCKLSSSTIGTVHSN